MIQKKPCSGEKEETEPLLPLQNHSKFLYLKEKKNNPAIIYQKPHIDKEKWEKGGFPEEEGRQSENY